MPFGSIIVSLSVFVISKNCWRSVGIQTSYESVRRWCLKFPQEYGKTLRKRQGKLGDIWYLDEVFLSIGGKRQYLWRAVDQDGDVIDILVQSRRNKGAARRSFQEIVQRPGIYSAKNSHRQTTKLSGCLM